jgi:hypothetical protein
MMIRQRDLHADEAGEGYFSHLPKFYFVTCEEHQESLLLYKLLSPHLMCICLG